MMFISARSRRILLVLSFVLPLAILNGATLSVNLGGASGYAVLAGSGITVAGAVGTTSITGDIGTFPTSTINGLENIIIHDGTNHGGDGVSQVAKADLSAAYWNAAGRAYDVRYTDGFDLQGQSLTSGVYNSASSLFLTGTLTLDAQGNSDAVWIFQTGSTLVTASNSLVKLVGGAQASNVFWQVGSSATLGTSSIFSGSILSLTSITVTTGASVDGRVLASNGAVTLDRNTITVAAGLPPLPVDVYWNGSGTNWNELTCWSIASGTPTPNPSSMPGSREMVTFSTSAVSSAQTVNLNAAQSVLGVSFSSSGAVLLQAGGEDLVLTLAGGGITKTGSGAVTIGSVTAGQQASLVLSADQSWTSNDNTSALVILNGVSASTATDWTLTLNGTSTAANAVAGAISDHGTGVLTLNKSGTGTWILSGANSYTGATTVSGGVLSVNGSITSNVTVQNSGTLKGSGTITGNTTIEGGGTLAAGNSPGVLSEAGNLTFSSGSVFEWDLDLTKADPLTNRGNAYDGVNVGGALSGSDAIFRIILTLPQDFGDSFWSDGGHISTKTWTDIFTNLEGIPIYNWANIFGGGIQYAYSGTTIAPDQGSFSVSGNSLTWTAVPESSNTLATLLVAAGLLRRRRNIRPGGCYGAANRV